jgi:hypothetical protein
MSEKDDRRAGTPAAQVVDVRGRARIDSKVVEFARTFERNREISRINPQRCRISHDHSVVYLGCTEAERKRRALVEADD